jgi:hypothetical protein
MVLYTFLFSLSNQKFRSISSLGNLHEQTVYKFPGFHRGDCSGCDIL